ncbi:MAG: hypothetical protein ACK4SX_08010 [Alcanivoracaceae bacterium]
MRLNKMVTGLVLAGAVAIPAVHADDHGQGAVVLPTEQEARDAGAQAKQAGKEKGQQMKQAGKDTGAAAKQAGKESAEHAKHHGAEMKQQGKATAAAEEARKVPPGMAKRDEHPSTGKGSEQGQESRNAEEKPWWRFWN